MCIHSNILAYTHALTSTYVHACIFTVIDSPSRNTCNTLCPTRNTILPRPFRAARAQWPAMCLPFALNYLTYAPDGQILVSDHTSLPLPRAAKKILHGNFRLTAAFLDNKGSDNPALWGCWVTQELIYAICRCPCGIVSMIWALTRCPRVKNTS